MALGSTLAVVILVVDDGASAAVTTFTIHEVHRPSVRQTVSQS